MNKEQISAYFKSLQQDICQLLEKTDGSGRFVEDVWDRPEGGGGLTRIMKGGSIIEKGGVNFSAVHGELSPVITKALSLDPSLFFATGISIVMHPHNPMVPIIHMNVRYFEISDPLTGEKKNSWFGGGIDLTPHYIDEIDARFFHNCLKNTCDRFDKAYYPEFKNWADDYFFIPHRKETRGIGGIFFDRLSESELYTLEQRFDFAKAVGETFVPVYTELMTKNSSIPFTDEHKKWQHLRRGRYVEFNLVHDKGTKFGFDTNGRTESILMSMPPMASWEYDFKPIPNSMEAKTLELLRKGINWV